MTFPLLFTVSHEVFNGTGQDDLGNDTDAWADPVTRPVIAWTQVAAEDVLGGQREITDVDMAVPPEFKPALRDRITLPGEGRFEVIGVRDANHGFHGWKPGNVVQLRKVAG